MTRTGGCLCRAVRYRVDGRLRHILVCHCAECRRWAGRAWAATAAATGDVTIEGDVRWRPSPRSDHRASRGNCAACGSALFWRGENGAYVAVGAGSLDDSSDLRVVAHIWVDQAAEWERPADGLPAYPRGYPADAPRPQWLS